MLSHIRRVDIEFQSKCNRKCEWCPNRTLSRDESLQMSDELYTKILKELKDNNFGNDYLPDAFIYDVDKIFVEQSARLSLIGYQEPFVNQELLQKRSKEAYDTLNAKTKIVTNTNGDFLTKNSLDNLWLSNLGVMDYDNLGIDYWVNKLEEMNVLIIDIDFKNEIVHGIHLHTDSITVFCNWKNHMKLHNCGGYFKQGDLHKYKWHLDMKKRTTPCPELDYFISIAYDGSVMPCSCMRPDNPKHQEYIMGNVKDNTLLEIYHSKKAENFRKIMRQEDGKYPEPCKYCEKIRYENCLNAPTGYNFYGYKYLKKHSVETIPLNT